MIRLFGIAFRFHPLFILMMLLSALTGYFIELITLFGVVFIHELGHVAAARGFGWRIREVQLLPFGGVAVTEESGNVPAREELAVALAGPLQNAWLIGFALLMKSVGAHAPEWWDYLIKANLLIGLFNMLPVLPLDGGKVLLALLSYVTSYHKAIVYTTWISMGMSIFLMAGALIPIHSQGLLINVLAIGLFLFYSNWYGYRNIPYQFMRFLMSRERRMELQLKRGVLAQPILVTKGRTVDEVARMFMREKVHIIYVCSEKGVIERAVPEQKVIRSFFTSVPPARAISDLFM